MPDTKLMGCFHGKTKPHVCPFREEVRDDKETLCTCCDKCKRECASMIALAKP